MPQPRLIYAMCLLQAIFVTFDLLLPFITGEFLRYSIIEFLMAYLMGFLDFILIIGFLKVYKWAWLFGLAYNSVNILYYAFAFMANPIVLYLLLFTMRLAVIFMLRATKSYFGV
ncbi:MAG: hypothetical protein NZ922_06765 [Candidatus Methanomethyliaceae archaeon]|nr:hypothetical protein [Candidatus Methanomethyliaceae archaeon]MDW7971142.1 hypothetical protein [Nitrososphaerota archaeon]